MPAVHAFWSGDRLCLWAEDSPELVRLTPRRASKEEPRLLTWTVPVLRVHPFRILAWRGRTREELPVSLDVGSGLVAAVDEPGDEVLTPLASESSRSRIGVLGESRSYPLRRAMQSLRQGGSGLLTEGEAAAARMMMRVVSYAETVQLVPPSNEAGIDLDDFEAALAALASQGLMRRAPGTTGLADLERIAMGAAEAIEASPSPGVEWNLVDLLGDRLADLVGVSISSMTRYRTGQRATPDDVAMRLHVLAQIVSDLSGSYNAYGIRRWFDRPRGVLDGRTPGDVLRGAWDPEDEQQVVTVRELASALTV